MPSQQFKLTKAACFTAYFTMTTIFCLPPLLLATFREMYGISYTLLGTLILTNFCTQLAIDLIFTLFSKHFNIGKIVKIMPLITTSGLIIYAVFPSLFPNHAYAGLLIGTVIFSVSAGLSEVLLSPLIAAIPSDNPQKDMSMLHSFYAFGSLTMIVISTIFLKLFGTHNWMYLTLCLAVLPIAASVMFMLSAIPDMDSADSASITNTKKRTAGLALCVGCIFFGSCAENVMSNWVSGFMEKALHIDKALGDILGMAMFAVLLGITRITYAKYGKHIGRVLLIGMIGAAVCYIAVGVSTAPFIALLACALTGMFTSMLWPGTLIYMEDNIPYAGVTAYALMAAGGDLGASVAPQLMGIVVDKVSASSFAVGLGSALNLSAEQIGMKAGMLISSAFPIIGVVLLIFMFRYFGKTEKAQSDIK